MPSSLVVEERFRNMCSQWFPEAGTMGRTEANSITKTSLDVDRYVITVRKEGISLQNVEFWKRKITDHQMYWLP